MIRPQTCPICKVELPSSIGLESPLFPFCSERCKQVDFYRWHEEQYVIAEPLTPDNIDDELLQQLEQELERKAEESEGEFFNPDI